MTTTIRTADDALATPGKAVNIVLWTLQVLVALVFLAAGSGKLFGNPDMIALFDAIGFGQWFRYVSGSDTSLVRLKWWARSCSSSLAGRRSERCCSRVSWLEPSWPI